MKSDYPKGELKNPVAAECCSAPSPKEVPPTLDGLGEHFLDHTRTTFTVIIIDKPPALLGRLPKFDRSRS